MVPWLIKFRPGRPRSLYMLLHSCCSSEIHSTGIANWTWLTNRNYSMNTSNLQDRATLSSSSSFSTFSASSMALRSVFGAIDSPIAGVSRQIRFYVLRISAPSLTPVLDGQGVFVQHLAQNLSALGGPTAAGTVPYLVSHHKNLLCTSLLIRCFITALLTCIRKLPIWMCRKPPVLTVAFLSLSRNMSG